MLRLLILRHAKAENAGPDGSDHTRALTARGRADAARIGRYLAHHDLVPDHVLVSSATRARETWACAAAELDPAPPVHTAAQLYNASADAILTTLREIPATARRPLICGHNPGLNETALLLSAAGTAELRAALRDGMPTAALAIIEFAGPSSGANASANASANPWSGIRPQSGRLVGYVSPRLLDAATD